MTEQLRALVRKTRKTGKLLVAGMFVPIDERDYESGMRREIATGAELLAALQFDLETLQMANTYLRTQISPVDAAMEGWRLEGWHGFNFEGAAECSAGDRQRLLEISAGFDVGGGGAVYLIPRDAEPDIDDPHGRATFCATGDTLVFRCRIRGGDEQIYDCKVRRVYHPRREGCGPDR